MADIGVALAGGGHRATLFGLGAVSYLLDAGKGPDVSTISSIWGGSITNGWLGLEADLTTARRDEVDDITRCLATRVARQDTSWASPHTYLFLLSWAVVVAAALAAGFLREGWMVWVAWLVVVVLIFVIVRQRSWLARRAFEKSLFHGRPFTDLHRGVTRPSGVTDLQTSEHVHFSFRFVYSWRIGKPAHLHIADAVPSAALPGAFTPVVMRLAPHEFRKDAGLTDIPSVERARGWVS